MNKQSIFSIFLLTATLWRGTAFAAPMQTARYFNGPSIKNITTTSAEVYLGQEVLAGLSDAEKAQLYFEYSEPERACIMIYPTPVECLPKTTPKGQASALLTGLTPNTKYSLVYKIDSTIACVTTPCPTNARESLRIEFKTLSSDATPMTTTLRFRSRGGDVSRLQDILRSHGYFDGASTGYFGAMTLRAVKAFQKAYNISPTGIVGPRTRAVLNTRATAVSEHFEGTIQSVSTACFADGECSVTIDGKKVVTTIGWSREVVGSIKGTVSSIGDIETQKIGARAHVYAQKTADGYTLYGNQNYYIEVK